MLSRYSLFPRSLASTRMLSTEIDALNWLAPQVTFDYKKPRDKATIDQAKQLSLDFLKRIGSLSNFGMHILTETEAKIGMQMSNYSIHNYAGGERKMLHDQLGSIHHYLLCGMGKDAVNLIRPTLFKSDWGLWHNTMYAGQGTHDQVALASLPTTPLFCLTLALYQLSLKMCPDLSVGTFPSPINGRLGHGTSWPFEEWMWKGLSHLQEWAIIDRARQRISEKSEHVVKIDRNTFVSAYSFRLMYGEFPHSDTMTPPFVDGQRMPGTSSGFILRQRQRCFSKDEGSVWAQTQMSGAESAIMHDAQIALIDPIKPAYDSWLRAYPDIAAVIKSESRAKMSM